MSADVTDTVLGGLLVRQYDTWLTGALRRARRATLALAHAGPAQDSAEQILRAVAASADRVRGNRLTVVLLATDPDLPSRLGPLTAGLPAEVTVHPVPGPLKQLPVLLKAAGGAGAPTLTVLADPSGQALDDPTTAALVTAARSGRPADLLLVTGGRNSLRSTLADAGFPLVTEVDTAAGDDGPSRLFALGTGSDRNLETFKDALWRSGAPVGLGYRDTDGRRRALCPEPDPAGLAELLHAELVRSGPRTVTELRRYALTETPYRAADAVRALTALLDAGTVNRSPADGRLSGDVLIRPTTP